MGVLATYNEIMEEWQSIQLFDNLFIRYLPHISYFNMFIAIIRSSQNYFIFMFLQYFIFFSHILRFPSSINFRILITFSLPRLSFSPSLLSPCFLSLSLSLSKHCRKRKGISCYV